MKRFVSCVLCVLCVLYIYTHYVITLYIYNCIYIYIHICIHDYTCIIMYPSLCTCIYNIIYIYGDTCIHVRALWLLLVSLRRFVIFASGPRDVSQQLVFCCGLDRQRLENPWENHGEPWGKPMVILGKSWENPGKSWLTHGFWWEKKTMGKRFLCVSIVQHVSKVTLGLEVTGSNHWVNTHPLIEHANLIQFIPSTSDHWTWLQRLTWWKRHPPGTSGCVPSMGNLGEKMGISWEYHGEMHTSGQKNLSPMISMKKSSPHRTVPKGVPRACYIRGSFVTSEKVLGSIDSLTFIESYPISMKHPLNVAKQTQRCKSSLFIHGLLGFLGCVKLIWRAVCAMIRFHGMLMYLGHISFKKQFRNINK